MKKNIIITILATILILDLPIWNFKGMSDILGVGLGMAYVLMLILANTDILEDERK